MSTLPVYMPAAVAISCGFLVVITLVENVGISPDFLNIPVYYGTLYGPLTLTYWEVKMQCASLRFELPTCTSRTANVDGLSRLTK